MLTLLQSIVSVILIACILIQERSSGFSSVLGGSPTTPYQTRRGLEKTIFRVTVIAAGLFIILSIANLIV